MSILASLRVQIPAPIVEKRAVDRFDTSHLQVSISVGEHPECWFNLDDKCENKMRLGTESASELTSPDVAVFDRIPPVLSLGEWRR
jgi:hypothetical protein